MKLFMCCAGLYLLFATMVVTAPIRARRENVLNFLNDALATTTKKAIPTNITAYRNPPSKPVKEQDSEDMSEETSAESLDTTGFTDAFRDLDSHENLIPKVVEKDKATWRNTGVDQDNMGPMDVSGRLVRDQGSAEQSGPHGAHQASREQIDLNGEEGMTVDAQEAENLSGKEVVSLNGDRVTGSDSLGTNVPRKAPPGRVNGLNGVLAPDRSRELLHWDSLEDNNGRPAPVGNRGDTEYDETREFISSESSPIEHMPSSLSVPAKSRAS